MNKHYFKYAEKAIAHILSLPRKMLVEKRTGMAEGIHWGKVGNVVAYSDHGISRLMHELKGVNSAENETGSIAGIEMPYLKRETILAAARPIHEDSQSMVCLAKVARIFPKNPRFMDADLNGKKIRVRARSNKYYTKGMQITVRQIHGKLFETVGPLPKSKGKM
ncbi:MAG: hypothetical protein OEQ39_27280 [Gammaproteobacteria bacterium]|nr:hypothetical protein [Gammaproteobacteria bacterium]